MDSVISPKFISTDVLTKLFNDNLEPTIDNINYICNLTSSINYGLPDLTNEQIDFWISLLSYLRKLLLRSNAEIRLFNLPSIIEVVFITTQIAQICSQRKKEIPDLLQILEGKCNVDIKKPEKIIEFPIVPTIQYDGILTDVIEWFDIFKPMHKFELPTFETIIHYSIIISLIYCDQIHQQNLNSFIEFKKRSKYVFEFPTDFVVDVKSMPPLDDPFSFILIRSFFEDLNNVHLKRPFIKDDGFIEIMNLLLTNQETDETKFFSALVYIKTKTIPFSMEFCNSKFTSLLFLAICEIDYSSKISLETEKIFHFTPNFLMATKLSGYFSRSLDFSDLIDEQMASLFRQAKYVIEKVEPTPLEILTTKQQFCTLEERLHALGSLSVSDLREDVYSTVFSFWRSCASKLISELETVKVTTKYLNGLLGICRVAATFSKKNEFGPIETVLNHQKEEFNGELPSSFPTYFYSTPSEFLVKCESVHINFESLHDVLRYLILIAMTENEVKPNEKLLEINKDYYNDKELKDPVLFIALRFLYEKTFNTKIQRENKNDKIFLEILSNKDEQLSSSLNSLVFNQGVDKIQLNKEVFEKRELYFALLASDAFFNSDLTCFCGNLCRNGIQIASYVISHLQDEIENLVTRSSFDDKEAAKQLLKHKECLPLLNDKSSLFHLLLKIFLSDEQPVFNNEVDLDDSVEISAKLFVCKNKEKPPPTDFLIQIVKKCYNYLFDDPLSSDTDKNVYLYICGIMKETNIKIFEKEEEFFTNITVADEENSLNFINTVLYYTLLFLKEQDHPELIHYYSDFANHGLLSPKIKEILPKPEKNRSIYWILSTCTLPYNRTDLGLILEEIDPKYTKHLYQYMLLCRDVSCLVQILQDKRLVPNATQIIGYEYLRQSFDLFFNTDSQVSINKITKILIDEDPDFLIRYICSHILEYPDYSILIFKNFKIDQDLAIKFISNLPEFDKPIPISSLPFFEAILSPLSRTLLHSSSSSSSSNKSEDDSLNDKIKLKWDEDVVERKEGSIDIWKEKQYFQCEGNNDNKPHCAFSCFSCSMSDSYICTACATMCHKGHRVCYQKKTKFRCSCESNGTCIFGHLNEKENEQKEKINHPPASKLIDLMIAISKIKENNNDDDEENENKSKDKINSISLSSKKITSRLTKPISSICNKTYDLNGVAPRFCLAENKKDFINLSTINNQYKGQNQQLYKKHCSHVPLNFSDYVNGHIIIAVGKTLYSIDEITYEVQNTLQLNEEVMSVKVSMASKDMIILTALKSVVVCKSSNLEKIFTINPTNLDENNMIIQAEMPIVDKVCVVRRQCVQLYSIGNNNPIENYNVENDFITSSVFVNYQDRPFGVFALNTGRIALQVLGEGESGRFNHYSSIPSRFVSIFISYCPENGLFFIAAPGASLQYTTIDNIFKFDADNTYQLRSESGLRSEICFLSIYPNIPSIMLFVNPSTNTIFSLEFTDEGLDFSSIIINDELENNNNNGDGENEQQRGLSIFDSRYIFLTIFRTTSDIFAISSSGSLLHLELSGEINTYEYKAPPSFYTNCEIATTENAEIIGTDSTQNYNTLFHDSVAFFHVSVKRKIMTLILKDPSYSIVGFILSFEGQGTSHRPTYISVFGRRYNCLQNYSISVALLPHEVNPGKPLEIEFSNTATSEIAMQGIKIFIIKSDKIIPFLKTIKRTAGDNKELQKKLLDFQDDFVEPKSSIVENLMYKAATSIELDKDEINSDSFKSLVKLMYTSIKNEKFARSAVVRIVKSEKIEENRISLLKIWANELIILLNEKLIVDQLWEFVWRDYMLFPEEIKEIIEKVIWNSETKIGSAESIFSVFTIK